MCGKDYILSCTTWSCENGKYSASIIEDSVITCEEILEETKTVRTNFDERKTTCKTKNLYILLPFLLITIALLVDVSIYCYQIKCRAKQKHLLPYHGSSKFRKIDIKIYNKNG